jgi:hypothetical protein
MSSIIVFLIRLFHSSFKLAFLFFLPSYFPFAAGSIDFFLTELFANGPSLSLPRQLWGDSLNSYVYVGRESLSITRVAVSSRAVTLYAGTGANADNIAGPATSSPMVNCYGICGDTAGSLYVTCLSYHRIVKIDIPSGKRREKERGQEKRRNDWMNMPTIHSTEKKHL